MTMPNTDPDTPALPPHEAPGDEPACGTPHAATPSSRRWAADRVVFLLIIAGTLASTLVYPTRVPDALLGRIDDLAMEELPLGMFLSRQLRPILAFEFSVLVLKECVLLGFLLAALCVHAISRLLPGSDHGSGSGRVSPARPDGGFRPASLASRPGLWLLAALVFTGFSALVHSPTFYTSLRTFALFGAGVAAGLVLLDLRPGRRERRFFMAATLVAGGVVALVALLQHTGGSWWFLPAFEDPRNRMGSLIGHNTGMSSWLMFPLFFGIQGVLGGRRLWVRVACAALVALMLFVLIAAQSRAMWLIGGTMLLVGVPMMARTLGMRLNRRTVLAGLLVVLALVAVQTLAPRLNPLARHDVTLMERVRRDFDPDQLLRETRLRILVVSTPLVGKSPVIGHGFGSFQYVYPAAQGEYFNRHPDSRLGLTTKRTDLAHNDYLQMLVEGGVLGLLLVLVPVWLLARAGLRAWRALPPGHERAQRLALALPLVTVALHGLVDFPFHIAPLAMTAVVTLALWAAPGMPRAAAAPEESPVAPPAVPGSAPRPAAVVMLVACGLVLLWSVFAYVFVLRDFVADSLMASGNNWLRTARAYPPWQLEGQRIGYALARERFRKATRVNQFNAQAYEGLVQSFTNLGFVDYREWQELRARGAERLADGVRASGIANTEHALHWAETLRDHVRELRYHYNFYQFGIAYFQRWRFEPNVPNWLFAARDAFEMALRLNPADSSSMSELAEVCDRLPQPDVERSLALRRRIFRTDPEFASQYMIFPAVDAADRGDFDRADRILQRAEVLDTGNWRVAVYRADHHLRRAVWPPPNLDGESTSPDALRWRETRLALGAALLRDLPDEALRDRRTRSQLMQYPAVAGDFAEALRQADETVRLFPNDKDALVFRSVVASILGEERPLWPGWKDDDVYYHRLQRIRMLFIPDQRSAGVRQLAWRAQGGHFIDIYEGMRAAAWLKATGEWDLVGAIARQLNTNYVGDPAVTALMNEVRARTTSADDAPTTATAAP